YTEFKVVSTASSGRTTARISAAGAGIALEAGPLPTGEQAVLGEPAAIDEALANVIKNALEACDRGGHIAVRTQALTPKRLAVAIQDDGRGIPSDAMSRLFVPFFSTKADGSGIGLAHVNHLMTGIGGGVDVESREGRGTTVTLWFRRAAG
ncbi:MAG: ATP-binding protein, partial [Myxococcota bacterium]